MLALTEHVRHSVDSTSMKLDDDLRTQDAHDILSFIDLLCHGSVPQF